MPQFKCAIKGKGLVRNYWPIRVPPRLNRQHYVEVLQDQLP
jgi:hypothetical protein